MKTIHLLWAATLLACNQPGNTTAVNNDIAPAGSINKEGKTIKKRFPLPEGYARISTTGFGEYLRQLPLKPHGSEVYYYNGSPKNKPQVYAAVVAMDIGNKDLQQCADAVMRLRAEYLYQTGQKEKIHFNFTNGFTAWYSKWQSGYRINVLGNKAAWVKTGNEKDNYDEFRKYMDVVFSYAGTLSLSKELKSVPIDSMQIGDILIQGGSPGHAVIIVDMAKDRMGNKIFMLAQSYMPAQDIQVLHNPASKELSPWYALNTANPDIITPEWEFTINDLKRFED